VAESVTKKGRSITTETLQLRHRVDQRRLVWCLDLFVFVLWVSIQFPSMLPRIPSYLPSYFSSFIFHCYRYV
jgi:hypothetical protein